MSTKVISKFVDGARAARAACLDCPHHAAQQLNLLSPHSRAVSPGARPRRQGAATMPQAKAFKKKVKVKQVSASNPDAGGPKRTTKDEWDRMEAVKRKARGAA